MAEEAQGRLLPPTPTSRIPHSTPLHCSTPNSPCYHTSFSTNDWRASLIGRGVSIPQGGCSCPHLTPHATHSYPGE